jgi:hypothetical protein
VCLNNVGGHRNDVTFVLTGLDVDAKAALVRQQLEIALADRQPRDTRWTLVRTDREDAAQEEQASAVLRCTVRDPDPDVVGRRFSSAAIELALASYPGFHVTAPPAAATPYGVFRAAYVAARLAPHVAVLPDGRRVEVPPVATTQQLADVPEPPLPEPLPPGPTRRAPLGRVVGARSGDKGGTANIGVWARTNDAWRWLAHALTADELRRLLPETAAFPVARHLLPALRAVNFVVDGLLDEGVASSTRFDPQAKAVGEWLRSRQADIPEVLL